MIKRRISAVRAGSPGRLRRYKWLGFTALGLTAGQSKRVSESVVAEPKRGPGEDTEIDTEERMAGERIADSPMGRHRRTVDGGQQDRAEQRGSRDDKQDCADDFDDANKNERRGGPSKLLHRLVSRLGPKQFGSGGRSEHKESDKCAQNPAGLFHVNIVGCIVSNADEIRRRQTSNG